MSLVLDSGAGRQQQPELTERSKVRVTTCSRRRVFMGSLAALMKVFTLFLLVSSSIKLFTCDVRSTSSHVTNPRAFKEHLSEQSWLFKKREFDQN